jgi:hypothetical protein
MARDERNEAESESKGSARTGTGRIRDAMAEGDDTDGDAGQSDETDDEAVRVEIEPLDTPIEQESIDPENALFVVLGMALTVLVVVRFLSVLP